MKILLIHGPNLNLLGSRQPEKYGNSSSEEILQHLQSGFSNGEISYFQSNSEAEIIREIQEANHHVDGILINAGGYSHTSIAIADAIRSIAIPAISIHISNIYNREIYRHTDIIGDACFGTIAGLGIEGYALALECLYDKITE
jgi:3-dehydroquinate dehydratase-2